MDSETDHIELVKKAQLGEKNCLNSLAEVARVRLREYVYRLTLQEDLTEDIIQESILEMFKVFDKLRDAERFWYWLYGIAFNKIRSRYGKQWRHRTVSLSDMRREIAGPNSPDGLADVIAEEWKQIVTKSIRELEPRHRAILTMRCYDKMAYSEIARIMDCTEIGVRALFYRAKKNLAKKLSSYGLGKGALLTALVLFGKMTATSEAAAANVSVTAGTIKVGTTAAFVSAVASKTAIISLTGAGVITIGALAVTQLDETITVAPQKCQAESCISMMEQTKASNYAGEYWYFFPEGADKAMMIRLMKFDGIGSSSYCQGLQNQYANYHFDDRRNAVCINNYRMWEPDLSVWRLPTDGQGLSEFISQVEGRQRKVEYIFHKRRDGLVVIAERSADYEQDISFVNRHRNMLEEEYFQWDWPKSLRIIDNRDSMHRRGWTYFTIDGQIDDRTVKGAGRIPFVYEKSSRYWPWMRLKVGDEQIIDAGDGELFTGFSRPWMGLHAIDTVRRDAAERRIWFETKLLDSGAKAEVTLTHKNSKLVYTIDMEADVIDKITFYNHGQREGEIRISYLQSVENAGAEFVSPRSKEYTRQQREDAGIFWLFKLISSTTSTSLDTS